LTVVDNQISFQLHNYTDLPQVATAKQNGTTLGSANDTDTR